MLMSVKNGTDAAKAAKIVSRKGSPKTLFARNPAPRNNRTESATLKAKVTEMAWSMVPRTLRASPSAW
jgi:hypothetical protein